METIDQMQNEHLRINEKSSICFTVTLRLMQ